MSYVEAYLGEIRMFAGDFAPTGWAFCEGQSLPIDQYPALFSLLGINYGGDGRQKFSLPDLRGRIPVHPNRGRVFVGSQEDGAHVAGGNDAALPSTIAINHIICIQGVFPARS